MTESPVPLASKVETAPLPPFPRSAVPALPVGRRRLVHPRSQCHGPGRALNPSSGTFSSSVAPRLPQEHCTVDWTHLRHGAPKHPAVVARVPLQTLHVCLHLYSTDCLDCLTCLACHPAMSCLRVFLATMTSHGNLISTPRVEAPFLCSLISYPAASWPPPVRRPHHDWKGALFSCRVNCRLKINGPIVVKMDMAERLNKNAVPGGIHGTTTWQCGFPT